MKQRETCPFATKMIQEEHGQEEILAHMKDCPVCNKIAARLAFEIQQDLGLDPKENGKPGNAISLINSVKGKTQVSGQGLSATEIVLAVMEALTKLDVDVWA